MIPPEFGSKTKRIETETGLLKADPADEHGCDGEMSIDELEWQRCER